MSKIRIKATIQNRDEKKTYEGNAILENNKIKYKEDNHTTVIWNENDNTLFRETEEIILKYPFIMDKTTTGTIELKEGKVKIQIPIHTKKLERKNHNIIIEFKVEENAMLYCIEEII